MSEINLQFTVDSYSTQFTVDATTIEFTPSATQLTVYPGFAAVPPQGAGGDTQVIFNNSGLFGGSNNFTYNNTSNTLTSINLNAGNISVSNTITVANNAVVANNVTAVNVTVSGNVNANTGNVRANNLTVLSVANIGSIGNVKITGGSNGQYLRTDGAGNLNFYTLSAGGSNTQLQYNLNGNFAGISNVTYDGSYLSLGNVGNVRILGGTNGYVLQTDGTGNLGWTAQSGGGGNGSPGGANSQIQYNDSGLFGGDVGFTYDSSNNLMAVQNIDVGVDLDVVANITAGNVKTDGLLYANGSAWDFVTEPGGSNTQLQFNNSNSFGGINSATFNTSTGTLTMHQLAEPVIANITGSTGTVNFDVINQSIYLKTGNATANFTLNIRGDGTHPLDSIMDSNSSMTCTFINRNGATGYYANVIKIDGTTITPKWFNNTAPVLGSTSAYDAYTFNIIKTAANTYTVLASTSKFGGA